MARRSDAYVDTSALIVFLDRSDTYNPLFRRLFANPPLVTSALVIAETHGWLEFGQIMFDYALRSALQERHDLRKWLRKFRGKATTKDGQSWQSAYFNEEYVFDHIWAGEKNIRRKRLELGRLWPESYQELENWLQCDEGISRDTAYINEELFHHLKQLSKRRFNVSADFA